MLDVISDNGCGKPVHLYVYVMDSRYIGISKTAEIGKDHQIAICFALHFEDDSSHTFLSRPFINLYRSKEIETGATLLEDNQDNPDASRALGYIIHVLKMCNLPILSFHIGIYCELSETYANEVAHIIKMVPRENITLLHLDECFESMQTGMMSEWFPFLEQFDKVEVLVMDVTNLNQRGVVNITEKSFPHLKSACVSGPIVTFSTKEQALELPLDVETFTEWKTHKHACEEGIKMYEILKKLRDCLPEFQSGNSNSFSELCQTLFRLSPRAMLRMVNKGMKQMLPSTQDVATHLDV